MKDIVNKLFGIFGLLALVLGLTGCPKKPATPALETPEEPVTGELPAEEPMVPMVEIGTEYGTAAAYMETVYFDYMKADLTESSRASLKKNASVLKTVLAAVPSLKVRIEGHCDERGTLEYNLALGERRAKAVRDYYGTLGIKKSALTTVSYGEERPVCTDTAEDCWWRNRRGETTWKAAAAVQVPLSK
jgi:peptidoglycan-associated lipoprotein